LSGLPLLRVLVEVEPVIDSVSLRVPRIEVPLHLARVVVRLEGIRRRHRLLVSAKLPPPIPEDQLVPWWRWREGERPPGWLDLEPPRPTKTPAKPAEHSWHEQDVVALGNATPQPPEIGGLLYPGRRHVLSGEAEAGKSWLALALAADELQADRGVVWVDGDDMGPGALLERLRALGVADERIRDSFGYLRPAEPLDEASTEHVQRLLVELSSRLVVFDAFNPALALHGYDPNATRDVEDFFRRVVDPFCQIGAAVALPDHVVKQREARGKYAYGSERKQTGVDVHLGLSAIESFGRGKTGKAKLTVHKDRPGFLERPSPGLFVLASDEATGECSWRIEPDYGISDEGGWRPTGLMEKVSRYLELAGEARSRNQIVQAVKGKTDYKRQAIDELIAGGYAIEVRAGQTRLVQFERAFRESDEWDES
jgi:AAA domain